MSDSVVIALIGAAVVLIVLVVAVLLFRPRITSIEAGAGVIKISLAEKQSANESLMRAEQSKGQEQNSSAAQLQQARKRIEELERKLQKTVLWVDDHPSNNVYESEVLKPLGIQVIQVKSNAEAYREIDQQRPQLIITDVGRDDQSTDGIDLVNTLAEQKPGLPIIVYTSPGSARAKKADALSRGARAVTAYPAELIQLVIDYLK